MTVTNLSKNLTEATHYMTQLALQAEPDVNKLMDGIYALHRNNKHDDPIVTQSIVMGLRAVWSSSADGRQTAMMTAENFAVSAPDGSNMAKQLCHEWASMAVPTSTQPLVEQAWNASNAFEHGETQLFKIIAARQTVHLMEQPGWSGYDDNATLVFMGMVQKFAKEIEDADLAARAKTLYDEAAHRQRCARESMDTAPALRAA